MKSWTAGLWWGTAIDAVSRVPAGRRPPVDGGQRPVMHFDFQVGDLDSSVAEAMALGATLPPPGGEVRALEGGTSLVPTAY
ncbi:VOC family protein [Streptomyces sp. BRB040]|uniref:VOC family protein n=1 Tax=Streptomyces sp. BRB040 TaxID=3142634 RepID=UPI0031F6AB12